MTYRLLQGNIESFSRHYQGDKFHAILCDPPYHLTSITKRFGKPGSSEPVPAKDGAFNRLAKGFMNKTWDGGDIAFRAEVWVALAEHLHPGGFMLAFSSTRTFHRMAIAMENAGLIMHPFLNWVFASGFPKATRVKGSPEFQGHRYGGQVLKPACEPILCFQKPYAESPRDCILATGAGVLNVEGTRIAIDESIDDPRLGGNGSWKTDKAAKNVYEGGYKGEKVSSSENGRWAANLLLQHSPDCAATCVPGCPVALLDTQSGNRKPGGKVTGNEPSLPHGGVVYGRTKRIENQPYEDEGGASRFFFQAAWHYEVAERLTYADPFFYSGKASKSERNAGLDHLPLITVNDGREKAIDNAYQRGETGRRNPHPTVKPIALTQYLATLLLPPPGYQRRILIPFAGVGSEMIGAMFAGWEEVVGVELDKEYVAVAEARLKYWETKGTLKQPPKPKTEKPAKPKKLPAPSPQLDLFAEVS